jgi:hypothetical protein
MEAVMNNYDAGSRGLERWWDEMLVKLDGILERVGFLC